MSSQHVAVRLDKQTLDRIEALTFTLSTPWGPAGRSDVLRALIHAGLDAHERRAPEEPAAAKKAPRR